MFKMNVRCDGKEADYNTYPCNLSNASVTRSSLLMRASTTALKIKPFAALDIDVRVQCGAVEHPLIAFNSSVLPLSAPQPGQLEKTVHMQVTRNGSGDADVMYEPPLHSETSAYAYFSLNLVAVDGAWELDSVTVDGAWELDFLTILHPVVLNAPLRSHLNAPLLDCHQRFHIANQQRIQQLERLLKGIDVDIHEVNLAVRRATYRKQRKTRTKSKTRPLRTSRPALSI